MDRRKYIIFFLFMHKRINHNLIVKKEEEFSIILMNLFQLQLNSDDNASLPNYRSDLSICLNAIKEHEIVINNPNSREVQIKTATTFKKLEEIKKDELITKHTEFINWLDSYLDHHGLSDYIDALKNITNKQSTPIRIAYNIEPRYISVGLRFILEDKQSIDMLYNWV